MKCMYCMQKWGLLWLFNMHSSHNVVCGYFSWLKCNYTNILTKLIIHNKKKKIGKVFKIHKRLYYLHLLPSLQHNVVFTLSLLRKPPILSGLMYYIPIFCAISWWTFTAFSFMNQLHFKLSTWILSQPFDSTWIIAPVLSFDSMLPPFTALHELPLWSA